MAIDFKRKRAEWLIKNERQLAFDVAANHGQIFYNVMHMEWFIQAVMKELD